MPARGAAEIGLSVLGGAVRYSAGSDLRELGAQPDSQRQSDHRDDHCGRNAFGLRCGDRYCRPTCRLIYMASDA